MINTTLVRVLTRAQATRGRLAFAGLACGLLLLTALLTNLGSPSPRVVADIIGETAFSFVVPVVTLLFAVACLGDLVEDHTLVYVWLRPIRRLSLATSAVCSTLLAAGAPVVGGLLLAAVLGGRPVLLLPGLVAGTLAVAAYGSLFVALGLRTTRSLLWGLAYLLLWEGLASSITLAFARLSLRRYAASVYADLAGTGNLAFPTSAAHGIGVLVAVAAAGTALTAWFLRRADVA
ncbi:MAG TPA: hypothetical protein VGA69_11535 [Nitriliruptorales bacterium]